MILVSEAGSTFWSGLDAASSWPLFTSMTIQALAAMVGAGTADTSPTGTTPVVAGTAAAGAVAAAGACCCARTGAPAASSAANTAPDRARRAKTTGIGRSKANSSSATWVQERRPPARASG